jgi:adenosylcobyric acid synthase
VDMQQPIMIQGTSSDAGKTTIVAGLCRLLANRGLKVAPFKSQNMALNSYVTESGEEIARATAVQAFGARQVPIVHMNPLLLKPKADDVSQLIVHGKALIDVTAKDYFLSDALQDVKIAAIRESIAYLRQHYDLIIAEGAGSCAEPNLRKLDVVNMGLAHELQAKVIIVADIAKGGVFADILGSLKIMDLTEPRDIELIAGFIINKFRGDRAVLQPAIDFIELETSIPVIGVLPFMNDLKLEEEDRIKEHRCENPEVDIAVIYLPHISNANDFDFLAEEDNVQVRFVKSPDSIGLPDAIIIPGTKNTVWDLDYMRRVGLEKAIEELAGSTPVVGICGGYQMLGRTLWDSNHVESELGTTPGMGLLDFDVEFLPNKTVTNRKYTPTTDNIFSSVGTLSGYEIHSGIVRYRNCKPMFEYVGGYDGAIHPEKLIFGTFIHDIFRNPAFRRTFVNNLRQKRGLPPLTAELSESRNRADESYEELAAILEQHASF